MRYLLYPLLFVLSISEVEAQWLNYPTPGIPRTRDGKPSLAARAPRTREGKPDLSGVWHVEPTTREEWTKILGADLEMAERTDVPGMELTTVTKYAFDIFLGLKPEEVPMRPEAKAIMARRGPGGPEVLPSEFCLPISYPLAAHVSEVTKIVQTPGLTIMLVELDNTYRQIYSDGRPLPKDPSPSWYGYSVGKWEGDSFVVETNGLNDKGWLDIVGHPRSEAMRMTERYRRRDFGHMDVEITFDDQKLYTKPFSIKVTHLLQADSDILEDVCAENERDKIHTGGK